MMHTLTSSCLIRTSAAAKRGAVKPLVRSPGSLCPSHRRRLAGASELLCAIPRRSARSLQLFRVRASVEAFPAGEVRVAGAGVTVREVQAAELEAAAQLRAEAYYEDSAGRYVATFKKHFVQQEVGSLRGRTQVSPNGFPECVCLVAVDSTGAVLGTLDVRPPAGVVGSTRLQRDGRYLNGVPVGEEDGSYVLNVCVAEESRGAGIGSAMMAEAAALARERWGAGSMFTEVDTWNEPACALYARLGYSRHCPEGEPPAAPAPPGSRSRYMLCTVLPPSDNME
mmetsp:Transcript_12030/g.30878  ORF Transcript_12030/g.30878 Transcript_12030/m.30878 type:complete len:282 (+) Transcript_12030:150-995(+)|eukprot:jgi/Tetstr1/439433/TSEL_027867.t1